MRRGLAWTALAGSALVGPKLLFGHCLLHLIGVCGLLGFDPLHLLALRLFG